MSPNGAYEFQSVKFRRVTRFTNVVPADLINKESELLLLVFSDLSVLIKSHWINHWCKNHLSLQAFLIVLLLGTMNYHLNWNRLELAILLTRWAFASAAQHFNDLWWLQKICCLIVFRTHCTLVNSNFRKQRKSLAQHWYCLFMWQDGIGVTNLTIS